MPLISHTDQPTTKQPMSGESDSSGEATLRADQENLLRRVTDGIPGAVYQYQLAPTGEQRVLFMSRNVMDVAGVTADECMRDFNVIWRRIVPEDIDALRESIARSAETGLPWEHEFRLTTPQGELKWLRGNSIPEPAASDGSRIWNGILLDVTARKRSEELLVRLNQRTGLILESAGEGIFGLGLDGNVTFANAALCAMLGWREEELLGRNAHMLWHHSYLDNSPYPMEACPIYETFCGGQKQHRDGEVFWRKDGSPIPVEYTVAPIAERKEILGVVVVCRDISERKQMEERLRQASKMEAVGKLAGGVAHDFNNLLTIINGYSDIMLEKAGLAGEWKTQLAVVKEAGERAAELTRQLLLFSRQQVVQPRLVQLNTVLGNILQMVRRLIGENIRLVTSLAPALGMIKADPNQLEQVVLNLAVNARDAMAQGGILTIETATVSSPSLGAAVQLTVRDTGHGMDAQTLTHLFEPFFTTKAVGKGTGLGLAMVYGVVTQSGGTIRVESQPGHGATFIMEFPCVEEEPVAVITKQTAPKRLGHESILLVEDEEAVRQFMKVVLESNGYHVVAAATPEEALRQMDQSSRPIQLLVTDMVMPDMNGWELLNKVQQRHAAVKALIVSGYTDNLLPQSGLVDGTIHFLAKPFTSTSLADKVQDVLEAVAAS